MDWLPWLVENAARVVVGLTLAAGNFLAAAGAGAVVAVVVARMEARRRRSEVRAAEKRAQLEPVRRYALGLQEFIEAAVGVVQVRQSEAGVGGREGSTDRVLRALEREWEKVMAVEPRPGILVYVRDREAQKCVLRLKLWGMASRDRCLKCLESGELMEEEATSRVDYAVDTVGRIEAWIRQEVGEG